MSLRSWWKVPSYGLDEGLDAMLQFLVFAACLAAFLVFFISVSFAVIDWFFGYGGKF